MTPTSPIWRPTTGSTRGWKTGIKEAKECGLSNFPCSGFQATRVWLLLVQMAQDLLAWARQLCLPAEFSEAAPKRLRYQLLHVAGRLVRSGRRSTLRLDARWPWAAELATASGPYL